MRDNKKKIDGKMSREEYLYHNTEMLLKKYRDVVWSIEVSAIQAQISFELEMDCKLNEFLEMSYAAGIQKGRGESFFGILFTTEKREFRKSSVGMKPLRKLRAQLKRTALLSIGHHMRFSLIMKRKALSYIITLIADLWLMSSSKYLRNNNAR